MGTTIRDSTLSLARPDTGDDVRLYNVADYMQPGRRYSRIYHTKREVIDQIMVSHELLFHRPCSLLQRLLAVLTHCRAMPHHLIGLLR